MLAASGRILIAARTLFLSSTLTENTNLITSVLCRTFTMSGTSQDAHYKANSGSKKNVSEQYQKLSQLEHILKRPDTYIGSTEHQESVMWIYNKESEQMEERKVNIVPGLFKIFDEILVNAADNKIRDPSMKKIEVTIKPEENLIEVKNDGKGIPIEIHEKENMYVPELIFGNLLTSSNYDDDEKKVTGGRNGYGAKLCNIFSTKFIVETCDKSTQKKYTQVWENNMSIVHQPSIKKQTAKNPIEYTKISFYPDLAKFHMDILDEDILGVLRRRVYDLAGTVKDVAVYLNGERLKIKNFKEYVELYMKAQNAKKLANGEISQEEFDKKPQVIYKKLDDPKAKGRWEIAFGVSESSFNQISFVNSIATTTGGTHINYISDQIADKIGETLKKKHKQANIRPFQIKNNLFIFVNCLIENPAFSSQTKEQLTTKRQQFGSDPKIPDDFIAAILKTEFIERILDIAQANADKALKKTDGAKKSRITNHPKLEDANKAGTKEGYKCTLILTEGDSALSLAIAGLAVVGRDYYGCFPLRGKMLNVREASADQVTKNAEIQAIKQIMGLQHKKKYEDTKSLRYGRIMIMTDQDTDGSHIKGLIINFLESSFPGLLHIPGFLLEFITPIVKVNITKPRKETLSFYNMPEYETWIENESKNYTWSHKYYKGLGTSSQEEGREYFSDLDRHLKTFNTLEEDDKGLIDLAFSKKKADDRKEWLRNFIPGTHLDVELSEIPISEFINKELILFSMADNTRSIPSVLDGFKPGQRKILYGSFKRNLRSEIKVAQLAGYVSEHTGYHHGEQSLVQTIIGLAQDFVGANNINLLKPNGSFGTRNMGGKDASAARYIYTELSSITRKIFNPADDPLYAYEEDDGETVEPTWYLPVIPMVLVNGAEGIGTGWSTQVPQFNPKDIVKNIRKMMNDEEMDMMIPWYKGWEGQIQKAGLDRYRMFGKIERLDKNTLAITELPAKTWTSNIKEMLLQGLSGTDKQPAWIKDMTEQHGLGIRFIVTLTDEEMKKTEAMGFYERFKLTSSISLSNMMLFDPNGKMKKYTTPNQIIEDFYWIRLDYYQRRKDHLAKDLSNQLEKISSQARFIKMIIDKKLSINNRKRVSLVEDLQELKFPKFDKKGNPIYDQKLSESDLTHDEIVAEEDEGDSDDGGNENLHKRDNVFSSYDYLLGMPIWSLTKERYEKLLRQKAAKEDELTALLKLSAKDIWNNDLNEFLVAFDKFLKDDHIKRTTLVVGKRGKGKKKNLAVDDDDWGSKSKSKGKKKEIVDNRRGDLIKMPPYFAPKIKVKKETKSTSVTPKIEPTDDGGLPFEVKKESNVDTKQSTLPLGTVKKEEKPKFTSIFGKGNTIFDDDTSTNTKSEAKSTTPEVELIDISSDEDEKPAKKPKTTIKKPADKKAPSAKQSKKRVISDDEDDDFDLSIADLQEPAPRRATRPAAKKSRYADPDLSDDFLDDASDDFVEDFDEENDESDYTE